MVGRHPPERSCHEKTVRFQPPATNGVLDEIGTMERHAGQGRISASHHREPTLTFRFRAPPNHSNQSSISETAAPRSISTRPQYDPYWPSGNTAHHANPPSNRATSNPARGKGKRRSPHNGASIHDVLQHAREAEASVKTSSGIRLALIRCNSRDDKES